MATAKSITINYIENVQRDLRDRLNTQVICKVDKYHVATTEEDLEALERAAFIISAEEGE